MKRSYGGRVSNSSEFGTHHYFEYSRNIVDRAPRQCQITLMSELETTAACLEALGNPTRLTIYRLLVRAGEEGKSVGQIQAAMSMPPSTLSHHLKHLELVGLVRRRREGTTHMCVANYMTMNAVLGFLTEECCADSGAAPGNPHAAHKISA